MINLFRAGKPWTSGKPAELASKCVQLAASHAGYATGNIYDVGGGQGQPWNATGKVNDFC